MYKKEAAQCGSLLDFLIKSKAKQAEPVYIITEKYMSFFDSIDFMEKWMRFQFPTAATRSKFVTDLFSWINGSISKKKLFILAGML